MSDTPIIVELVAPSGERLELANVQLDLSFYMDGHLRYSFDLGSTDAEGVCRSSLHYVEQQLESNRKLFLMDYNTPLEDCDSRVGVRTPTADELARRLEARHKWFGDAASWDEKANQAVHSAEQKFVLERGSENRFKLAVTQTPR